MSKQLLQTALDALWVLTEHDALHFGENHNTVLQGRAAIAELRAEIAKPVEPVAWTVTEMDSVITNSDKQTNAIQFSQRYLDMHDIPLHTTPPDTEGLRRDAERYRAIRNGLEVDPDNSGIVVSMIDDFGGSTLRGDAADQAIDAAMVAQGRKV
jgi:hypothetical protein